MKYCADQQATVFAQVLIGQEVLLDLLEAIQEEVACLLVAVVKFAHHVAEQRVDVGLGKRHQPRQDSLNPLGACWFKWADDDPAVGGFQDDAGSPDLWSDAASWIPEGDGIHSDSSYLQLTEGRERRFRAASFRSRRGGRRGSTRLPDSR